MEFYVLSGTPYSIAKQTADEHVKEHADHLIKACLATQRALITLARVVHLERTMRGKPAYIDLRRVDELEEVLAILPDAPGAFADWFGLTQANWGWGLDVTAGFMDAYVAIVGYHHPLSPVLRRLMVDSIPPVMLGRPLQNPVTMTYPFEDKFDYGVHQKKYFKKYHGRVTWSLGSPSWWKELEWQTRFASSPSNDKIVS